MVIALMIAERAAVDAAPNAADLTAAWAAVVAAVTAGGGWITGIFRDRRLRAEAGKNLAVTQGFVRFEAAIGHLYGGSPDLALQGVGILRDLRQADWIDDAMRNRAAQALRDYTEAKSRGR